MLFVGFNFGGFLSSVNGLGLMVSFFNGIIIVISVLGVIVSVVFFSIGIVFIFFIKISFIVGNVVFKWRINIICIKMLKKLVYICR